MAGVSLLALRMKPHLLIVVVIAVLVWSIQIGAGRFLQAWAILYARHA